MKRLAPLLALLVIAAGAVVFVLLREPEPTPEPEPEVEEGDTGFSRQAVEERMRAIGYVQ